MSRPPRADAWDASTPVEKSSYLNDDETLYFNADAFGPTEGKLTHLDLFCGAGGFSVGCGMSGFQSVAGIDHFEPAMKTWCLNHPHALGVLGDIRKIDPGTIKEMLEGKGIDKINLLTGGVPCQGFSRANRKHNDDDERNFLFLEYMKFVRTFRPDYLILENVSGMRETAGGRFEKEIKGAMEGMGYAVNVKLLNAADYGVPQRRKRVIVFGVRDDVPVDPSDLYPSPSSPFEGSRTTVAEALSDLYGVECGDEARYDESAPMTLYQKEMRSMEPYGKHVRTESGEVPIDFGMSSITRINCYELNPIHPI